MIVDIEKEQTKNLKNDFAFIKECLWPGRM